MIKVWYSPGEVDKIKVVKIAMRFSSCGKETMIYIDIMNTTYQDIINPFLLNKMLQHIGMLWIIGTHEQLKYDMDKHYSYWMTGGT